MMTQLKILLSAVAACTLTVSVAQDASIKGTPYVNETYEQGIVFLEKMHSKFPPDTMHSRMRWSISKVVAQWSSIHLQQ